MALIPGAIGKQQAIFDFLVDLQTESVLYETDSSANCKRRRLDTDSYATTTNGQLTNGTVQFPITIPTIDPQAWSELLNEFSKFEKQSLAVEWNYAKIEDSIFAAIKVITKNERHLIAENECVIMSNQFKEDKTEIIGNDTELLVAIIYAGHTTLIRTSNIKLYPSTDRRTLLLHMDLVYNMDIAQRTRESKLMLALSNKVHIKQEFPQQIQSKNESQKATEPLKCNAPSEATCCTNNMNERLSTSNDRKMKINEKLRLVPSKSSSTSQASSSSRLPLPRLLAPLDPSIESFYRHIHPPVSNELLEEFTTDKITAKLTPFQTQNVQWMIYREGHVLNSQGAITPNHDIFDGLPLLHLDSGNGSYINSLWNTEVRDRSKVNELLSLSYRGGILADEMGLGKTVR
jgi:hypothetical protein